MEEWAAGGGAVGVYVLDGLLGREGGREEGRKGGREGDSTCFGPGPDTHVRDPAASAAGEGLMVRR